MIPWITVEVRFLSIEDGGRENPLNLSNGYMPHFRVAGDSEYLGVRFIEVHEGTVIPNEIIIVKVQLLYHPEVSYQNLTICKSFEILEGPRIVGKGKVINVPETSNFV